MPLPIGRPSLQLRRGVKACLYTRMMRGVAAAAHLEGCVARHGSTGRRDKGAVRRVASASSQGCRGAQGAGGGGMACLGGPGVQGGPAGVQGGLAGSSRQESLLDGAGHRHHHHQPRPGAPHEVHPVGCLRGSGHPPSRSRPTDVPTRNRTRCSALGNGLRFSAFGNGVRLSALMNIVDNASQYEPRRISRYFTTVASTVLGKGAKAANSEARHKALYDPLSLTLRLQACCIRDTCRRHEHHGAD